MKNDAFVRSARTCAASLLVVSPALATTWVVDDNGGPGVDFVDIQAAVDAAVDGDVIEVRDGAYPGFTIDGKSLVVVAVGSSVRVAAIIDVKNVGLLDKVELDGLRIGEHYSGLSSTTLRLLENPGSVRLIDCSVVGRGAFYGCSGSPQDALVVTESEDVTLLRCEVEGGHGTYYDKDCQGYPGRDGIRVETLSYVTVLDSDIRGGIGTINTSGGHGALVSGSVLRASSSSFDSGDHDAPSAPPGNGVRVLAGASFDWKDCTFLSPVVGDNNEVAIAPFCLGTFEECPCDNHGAGTAGCEHSFGTGGARLEGVGNASVSADTVTLQITGLNPSGGPTALFFQGTTGSEGTPFNDGLLCAGGTIVRMKGKPAINGQVAFGFGQSNDAAVSAAGLVPPAGATRFYQVWYRNIGSFCTAQRFNMSNGVEIEWGP